MHKERRRWFYYGFVIAAWAAYILLSAAAPRSANSDRVHLNQAVIIVLSITLFVPYLLTWLIAILGWYHFGRFARIARQKRLPNSTAFQLIASGLGFLVLDLIAIPFFSVARNILVSNQDAAGALTVASNYTHTILPLVAFGFLFQGSRLMARSSNYAISVRSRALPALIATGLFGLLFTLAVFSNPSRQVSAQSGTFATYYLPDLLILTTIVIPLIITWFLGLQTALNTERYVHALSKPGWKQAINKYFYGLLAVVSSAIILQGVAMIGSEQLQNINLALTLFVIYLFILLQAAGYLFIKSSAKQLLSLIETRAKS